MTRLVELVILINAGAAAGGFLLRRHLRERRQRNIDHVRQLHEENLEMDEMMDEMMRPPSERRWLRKKREEADA